MNVSSGPLFTDGASESTTDQVVRLLQTYGALRTAKCFYSGALPAAINLKYEGLVQDTYVGCKFDQVQLAAGKFDQAIRNYVASIPAGRIVRLIQWQEPDEEMWVPSKFRFTQAQHRAATERMCQVVHATEAYTQGRVEVWECLMSHSIVVDRYDPAAITHQIDGLAWDAYWLSPNEGKTDPRPLLDKMVQANAAFNKPYAILECGDRRPGYQNQTQTFANGTDRLKFWTRVFDHAESTGWTDLVWFNAIGTMSDHRLIPGDPYSDPLIELMRARMTA